MSHLQAHMQRNNKESHSLSPFSQDSQHVTLPVECLEHGQGLELPHYATSGSAGLDLRAALAEEETVVLAPGQRALIPTGLVFHLLPGFEAQIRPRSGLALKHGITCLNTPGTIDSDYRGEIKILLINLGQENFSIQRGMRIAQTVIAPVVQVNVCAIEPDQKDSSQTPSNEGSRGADGFGSTGHD
ncbi:Deoxyuridine 5'-triphosphate nucleotidohydrolase [Bartonella quintana]|uniref:Deoxyuridine 5'-triphosphate nucleotidohydrolase n=8 Tax=Bartonella quintana TaxID=803 RepID=DUT_BARQU|nr:RecName: Full=Deoxyuridine 5'-triphosphate nucleotidohydrolase; Short=dUTPase; AltName: Full=dUTP pyrophosphatase [Bartonella quintana str. Toulouse]ETS14688.1 deoxyuridine 5'-triphosphate nucleotidohydrolase [Bartonella quintana JK 73rel]ETS17121.1 deoxyuridine 5'-triphosphate nucleotidohydrolase [Bartonella quintana JK 73]ETS19414.1 deoxyuridine 5'-triphosphate nucleotidohydrolase [Bartonella quintana JK 7]KEC64932.1 deoxyuridine 5'-triphosphate nucleotidohydrolase [Bartonella quintana JK 